MLSVSSKVSIIFNVDQKHRRWWHFGEGPKAGLDLGIVSCVATQSWEGPCISRIYCGPPLSSPTTEKNSFFLFFLLN